MVSTTPYEELLLKLSIRKKRILDLARMGIDDPKFETFRKNVLDELGRSGFEGELEQAILEMERNGTGRNSHARREVSE